MGLFYTIFGGVKLSDVLLGLLTITCSYVFYFYYKYFTRVNPLPGPIPLPIIGSIAIFLEDIDGWFYKLNKKYGRNGIFEVNIAGNRQIVMSRTDFVEKFMSNNTTTAHIMRTANNGLLDLFDLHNKGVGLNHSFQHWKFNRQVFSQAVMPLSSTNRPSEILNPLFKEMADHWMDLKPEGDNGTTTDMAAWLRRFTADFISLLTTGKHISVMNHYCSKLKGEVSKEMTESEEFIECINTFVSDNQIMFVSKSLKEMPLIKSRVDKLLDNNDRFYNKLVRMIRIRRKEIEKSIKCGDFDTKQMDLLTTLIVTNTQHDPNPQKNVDPSMFRPMTDDEIRGVMFDAFVAGTDTTVNTFCFVVYYLAHHPEVKKKMLEEIESIYKDDPTRPIMLEDLDKLKYCEAIIKETSRIRPTVSMISRYSNRPDEIAGYKWPAHMLFIMYVRGINNNPLYWKDPETFMPERFYEGQEIQKNAFTMFGGGLRTCLGRKIAMIELKTLIALVYRRFDVELVDMKAPVEVETSTITVCKGLDVKIIPKENTI